MRRLRGKGLSFIFPNERGSRSFHISLMDEPESVAMVFPRRNGISFTSYPREWVLMRYELEQYADHGALAPIPGSETPGTRVASDQMVSISPLPSPVVNYIHLSPHAYEYSSYRTIVQHEASPSHFVDPDEDLSYDDMPPLASGYDPNGNPLIVS
jgi:hypothetical protein